MSVGEILLERGKITADHLQSALAARKNPHDRIDRILVRMGFVDEREVRKSARGAPTTRVGDVRTGTVTSSSPRQKKRSPLRAHRGCSPPVVEIGTGRASPVTVCT